MNRQNADTIGGGIFLIGLGILFMLDWFWPGILALIGVVAFINQGLKGNLVGGLTPLILFGGLTAVFALEASWRYVLPAALIVVGLIGLVNALLRR